LDLIDTMFFLLSRQVSIATPDKALNIWERALVPSSLSGPSRSFSAMDYSWSKVLL
jgi:hypothetical protein